MKRPPFLGGGGGGKWKGAVFSMRIQFFREATLESSSMPHSIAAGKTIPTASRQ